MCDPQTFQKGDDVRSSDHYGTQFPKHLTRNGGRPLKGKVRRVTTNGIVVVKWVQFASEAYLHPRYITKLEK